MDNRTLAVKLTAHAHQVEVSREASLYRVRAYRRAAQTLLALDRPAAEILEEHGRRGLERLPGIGSHLSYTIAELIRTGEFRSLHVDKVPA